MVAICVIHSTTTGDTGIGTGTGTGTGTGIGCQQASGEQGFSSITSVLVHPLLRVRQRVLHNSGNSDDNNGMSDGNDGISGRGE